MVLIPKPPDFTLQAIKQKTEHEWNSSVNKRGRIMGHMIGTECARALYYAIHNEQSRYVTYDKAWRFEDSMRNTKTMANRLGLSGIEVYELNSEGKRHSYSFFDSKLQDHCDGVLIGLKQATSTKHIWQNKTIDESDLKKFRKLKDQYDIKLVLKKFNEKFYARAQLLMHYLQIDRHYMTLCISGAVDVDACRTEYDPDFCEMQIDRIRRILETTTEPVRINDRPDFWLCRMCEFKGKCHNNA